jgi:hypothetical protein
MGIDFLGLYGARRMRNYEAQPLLLGDGLAMAERPQDAPDPHDLSLEQAADDWQPINIRRVTMPNPWGYRPRRFIDGKDVGRTVAWLQSRMGYPVPVRLSEIGAVVMRDVGGQLRREFSAVEKVVSLVADLFPWDEIEGFAAALHERNFRLLPVNVQPADYSFDFERMRIATQNRSQDEMLWLECRALMNDGETPTLVDGRLEPRAGAFDTASLPVAGVIKSHSQNYLHDQGWRTFYQLAPGERTPAFLLRNPRLSVVSWYLRLDGARGEMPNWGIVRVEIAEPFRQAQLGEDWRAYIDQLSRLLCDYRCRDESYGRAVVTIQPIQEAEHSLGSLFADADALVNMFYRMTNL